MSAKFRKISPSIWNDAKFRHLSDQAKLVFFLLLTHPHTSAVGTIRAYQEGLACEMQWSAKQFRERFAELSSNGMVKVDETEGLIWLPNYMKYNTPDNPNILKAWKGSFDDCPECNLKNEVFQACKLLAEQLGKGFKKAFDDCLLNGLPNLENGAGAGTGEKKTPAQSSDSDSAQKGGASEDDSEDDDKIPVVMTLQCVKGEHFDILQEHVDEFAATYPAVNVLFEIRRAITWCNANPKNRKTKTGAMRFLNGWLDRAQNKAARIPEITDERAARGLAVN